MSKYLTWSFPTVMYVRCTFVCVFDLLQLVLKVCDISLNVFHQSHVQVTLWMLRFPSHGRASWQGFGL